VENLQRFIHENTELETLEGIIDEFNIFTALNIVDNEIKHSDFLAWLMDPKTTHGVGDYFLTLFLKRVSYKASLLGIDGPSVFDIDTWDFDDAEILREWKNIDICIRCDSQKFICVIENKIYSGEHNQQLRRYRDVIGSGYPNYRTLFVYLTIEEEVPSESGYVPLGYSDILSLVQHLLDSKRHKLSSEILTLISHYNEMLRRYIMEDSQIQEICRKIYKQHKKALDLIFEFKPDKLLEISESLKEAILKRQNLVLDQASKSYIYFTSKGLDFLPKKGEGWTKSGRILLFELRNTQQQGVQLYLIIGPGPDEIRKKLYEIARGNLSLFNTADRKLADVWFSIYKRSMLKPKTLEDLDSDQIGSLLENELDKFIASDLDKIENEISKYGLSLEA